MLAHITKYLEANNLRAEDFPYRLHSPGRINLIGEHTDYTGGLVMPASIDKGIEFYARPQPRRSLILHAVDLRDTYALPLPATGRTDRLWVDYLAGITAEFEGMGYEVPGLEIVFGGDVPRGSGMSSSAALEGGMAFLLNTILDAQLSRPQLARLCKASSNGFIGIPSGIMDQFASLNGTAVGPLILDCHTLEFSTVSAELPGYTWMLVNSNVSHELTGSEYPERVQQCATALEVIQRRFPEITYLSAATREHLNEMGEYMSEIVHQRAHHVILENERVRHAAAALAAGDAERMGQLLNATHASLRDDYEVSCPEVDFLQEQAQLIGDNPTDVAGSRIMGGGFGGCTINLVRTTVIPALKNHLVTAYFAAFGRRPEFYEVKIGPGTRLI
ncbi:MAG: galactokinase [Bacteroidota bacterium]